MLDLYISNKNAIVAMESALRIAISNANNFNTPGYKYTFTSFTTTYHEAISSGTKSKNPIEYGSGMTMGSTSTDFSQGNITLGTDLDAAITGEGFYIISSSASTFSNSSVQLYSRAGNFQADSSNTFIVDDFGRKVFGFPVDENGNRTSTNIEPIQTEGFTNVQFQDGGILVGDPDSDNPVPLYKLALTSFQNKEGLIATTGSAYRETYASGAAFSPGIAGELLGTNSTQTYGDILGNSLEGSNVDIAKVALDMNLLNRGFAAVQAVIDDVTKILTEIIKKLSG